MRRPWAYAACGVLAVVVLGALFLGTGAEWSGVDDTVVDELAKRGGRPPKPPLLPMTGDLPLLLFLVAGAVGGFTAGYTFRALFPPARSREP